MALHAMLIYDSRGRIVQQGFLISIIIIASSGSVKKKKEEGVHYSSL